VRCKDWGAALPDFHFGLSCFGRSYHKTISDQPSPINHFGDGDAIFRIPFFKEINDESRALRCIVTMQLTEKIYMKNGDR
jgi:hypothetical protein